MRVGLRRVREADDAVHAVGLEVGRLLLVDGGNQCRGGDLRAFRNARMGLCRRHRHGWPRAARAAQHKNGSS